MNAPLPFSKRQAGEPISRDRLVEYHRRLQAWIDQQTTMAECSPAAYAAAAKRIAAECGI